MLYKSLVSAVTTSHEQYLIEEIEKVQKRATYFSA